MTDTPENPPNKRRWLMPLLLVSLAINLLIAGIFIGAMLSPDGLRNRAENASVRGVVGEPFFRALPREERRALIREVVRNRDKIRESREGLRQRFQDFLTTLRAETFDMEEARRLMTEQRGAAIRRQEIGEMLLLDRLQAMTSEQRRAYADALEDSLAKLRKR